ncbi:MAG: type II toxin-antitoxin system RelE/ParE family toxin [Clostridiales Family XIII bacterium]|nr:type II toxin-antitoxin system RelE/ParE family toxin [Clostridiales Family XIII bacterium]
MTVSHIKDGIARVLFTVDGGTLVLLHGFIKKSDKIPAPDLRIAQDRLAELREAEDV